LSGDSLIYVLFWRCSFRGTSHGTVFSFKAVLVWSSTTASTRPGKQPEVEINLCLRRRWDGSLSQKYNSSRTKNILIKRKLETN